MTQAQRGEALDKLAYSFAKPITRGYLTGSQAYAALALKAGDKLELGKAWQTTKSAVALYRDQQRNVALNIRIALIPLIGARKPKNVLLAEANGINGEAGFWLTEDQVEQIVREEVRLAMLPAPAGRRRGR